MEETEIAKYFEAYVGKRSDVMFGRLMCYGELYQVHPKFTEGVLRLYDYYKALLSKLDLSAHQIREADQVYTTKGDGFGNVSWNIDTYRSVSFQAVFVARKFSLRVYHILNMLTHSLERGFLREVESVGGYGSGPCMELRIAQEFFKVIGKSVTIHGYDPVDWLETGGLPNEKWEKYDLLITSFVLNNYVKLSELPNHAVHLALEGPSYHIDNYCKLNTASLMQYDKFSMWQNRNVILSRATQYDRPVQYHSSVPFVHYYADFTRKDRQVSKLLLKASGTILDVGAGGYDIRRLTKNKVIRQDIKPRSKDTVCEYIMADFVLFNMSLHHMDIDSILRAQKCARKGILVRDIDINAAVIDYEDAVHHLYELDPDPPHFVSRKEYVRWMCKAGWSLVSEELEGTTMLLSFARTTDYDEEYDDLQRYINDRKRDFLPSTIQALRAKHFSICNGSIRPFRNMKQWESSVMFCSSCNERLKPYTHRVVTAEEYEQSKEIQKSLGESMEVARSMKKLKRRRERRYNRNKRSKNAD